MRRIALRATALLLTASAGSGCQTTGPAAIKALGRSENPSPSGSDYAYGGGWAAQTFRQAPATVQPAVLGALDDLRVHSVKQTSDGGSIVFEAKTADNRHATVSLLPQSQGTRLAARVGLFGDQALSRALMDRVGMRLGDRPPAPVPDTPPSEPASNPYFSRSAISDAEMLKDQAEAPYRSTAVPDNKPY